MREKHFVLVTFPPVIVQELQVFLNEETVRILVGFIREVTPDFRNCPQAT
jgi:hypothetical protein